MQLGLLLSVTIRAADAAFPNMNLSNISSSFGFGWQVCLDSLLDPELEEWRNWWPRASSLLTWIVPTTTLGFLVKLPLQLGWTNGESNVK